MLPDADDFPSLLPELAVDAFVPGYVVLTLFIPEGAVGFGAGKALGAAMPEASVDENGELLSRKGKIGLSGQRKMPSPTGDLVSPEQRH